MLKVPSGDSPSHLQTVHARKLGEFDLLFSSIEQLPHAHVGFYSPNGVSTLRGSYGRCQGRGLIRVLAQVSRIFPVKFSIKWLLWNVDMRFIAFRLVQAHANCGPWFWDAAFFFLISAKIKVALLKSCHAFRLRRLAQSVGRGFGPKFRIKWLLWNLDMRAGSHKVSAVALRRRIFPANFCIVACEILTRVSTAQARTKCGPWFWAAAFFL